MMLKKAESFMRKKGYHLALLFCGDTRTRLYHKVGYIRMKKYVTYFSGSKLKKEPIALFFPIKLSDEEVTYLKSNKLHVGRGTW
jgi:hypothetical protein